MTTEIPQDIILPEHPFGPDSLYWSNDHQLLAVTRSTLFILTPNKERRCLGKPSFYQTIIQRDIMDTTMVAINGRKKEEIPMAKGMILSPRGFHQAQWSPIGCAPYHGCLIAAIVDTDRHIVFYAPESHPATFSWYEMKPLPSSVLKSANLQATVLAWSEQLIKSNDVPACIAFGYQTGEIQIWAWSTPSQQLISSTERILIHNTWVSCIAWSSWTTDTDQRIAYLAIACAMGSVSIWRITCNLNIVADDNAEAIKAEFVTKTLPADGRTCTVLRWYHGVPSSTNNDPFPPLAIAKSTLLYVWRANSQTLTKTKASSPPPLSYLTEGTMPITALVWLSDRTLQLISMDATCIETLELKSSSIISNNTASDQLQRRILKLLSYYIYTFQDEEAEEDTGKPDKTTNTINSTSTVAFDNRFNLVEPRVHGLVTTYHGIYTALLYFGVRPMRLNYGLLNEELSHIGFVFTKSSWLSEFTDLNRQLIEHLSIDKTPSVRYWDLLDQCLYSYDEEPQDTAYTLTPIMTTLDSLKQQLTSYDDNTSTFDTNDFWHKSSVAQRDIFYILHNIMSQDQHRTWTQPLLDAHHYDLTAIRVQITVQHLHRMLEYLKQFLATNLHKQHITNECMVICHLLFKSIELLPTTQQSTLATLSNAIKSGPVLRKQWSTIEKIIEPCPVCEEPIPFTDLLTGRCVYGHQWSRCTVTLQVPQSHHILRTCVDCQAKTIAPSWLVSSNTTKANNNDHSSDLFVNNLLQQLAPVCNYCGSSFYSVLGNK